MSFDITSFLMGKAAGGGGGGGSSGGGVLVVHAVDGTLDKTWKDIATAATSGVVVMTFSDRTDLSVNLLVGVFADEGDYGVVFADFADETVRNVSFITDNEDGYPTVSDDPGQD